MNARARACALPLPEAKELTEESGWGGKGEEKRPRLRLATNDNFRLANRKLRFLGTLGGTEFFDFENLFY